MNELMQWMGSLGAVEAALVATLFTWLMTALGASLVFVFNDMHRKWFDSMLGFTGGVMGFMHWASDLNLVTIH